MDSQVNVQVQPVPEPEHLIKVRVRPVPEPKPEPWGSVQVRTMFERFMNRTVANLRGVEAAVGNAYQRKRVIILRSQ